MSKLEKKAQPTTCEKCTKPLGTLRYSTQDLTICKECHQNKQKVVSCSICADEGWVCEEHPNQPWQTTGHEKECGAAGMPCTCNTVKPPWHFGTQNGRKL